MIVYRILKRVFRWLYHYFIRTSAQSFKVADTHIITLDQHIKRYYGDRRGAVIDPFGVLWWIATQVEEVPKEEYQQRAEQLKKQ